MPKLYTYPTSASSIHRYEPDGPGESFEMLYERYVKKVYQKCLQMTCDTEDARDYTHDIFLKAFDKLNTFQNRSSFATWLYSISHNYCVDKLKQNTRLRTESLSDLTGYQSESTESADNLSDQMMRILRRMPADEVVLLKLKYEQDISIKEISQRFNLKESTVKMRIKRARDKVRKLCEADPA